jgi:hypothetical protein
MLPTDQHRAESRARENPTRLKLLGSSIFWLAACSREIRITPATANMIPKNRVSIIGSLTVKIAMTYVEIGNVAAIGNAYETPIRSCAVRYAISPITGPMVIEVERKMIELKGIKNGVVRNGSITNTAMTTKDIHVFNVDIAKGVASSL